MKRKTFLVHLLFWVAIYLLWVAVFRSYSFTLSKTMTIEFCYLIFITADFYAINNFIVPRFLLKRKYALFVAATIVIIAVSAGLRAWIALKMNMHFFHTASTDLSALYLNSILNISLWVLLVTTGKMLIDKMQTQQQLELLEKERIKNELDYLKAQINPHALFNSLNTIYGHIDKNNRVARDTLLQFSELLRYQLYDCGAEKINIEKEIAYIKNFVAFQRLRKDETLHVNLDIDNIDTNLEIAPLLLVVLIENAFKFVSSYPDIENTITVRIYTKDGVLYSSVTNTKELQQPNTDTNSNGIGIVNLKRRLALLYPHKYEFTINNQKEFYETSLIIDLT